MLNPNLSATAAETRLNEIEQRINAQINVKTGTSKNSNASTVAATQENFGTTMAQMLQNQMYSQSFMFDGSSDNKDSIFGGGIGSSNMLNMGMLYMLQQNMAKRSHVEQEAVDFNSGLFSTLPLKQNSNSKMSYIQTANLPVKGRISSGFAVHNEHSSGRVDPFTGKASSHMGVDIAAPYGAPIEAPWNGVVTHVGNIPGFGKNSIVLAHPETKQADGRILYSVFGHNSGTQVLVGDQVAKGQVIGSVGSEGRSTGPHLHWETRWAQPNTPVRDLFKANVAMATNPLNFA